MLSTSSPGPTHLALEFLHRGLCVILLIIVVETNGARKLVDGGVNLVVVDHADKRSLDHLRIRELDPLGDRSQPAPYHFVDPKTTAHRSPHGISIWRGRGRGGGGGGGGGSVERRARAERTRASGTSR